MSWLRNITGRLYRGEVSYDFVGRKKRWYTISGLILVIAIAALLIRGLDYSVDFKGGSIYQFSSPKATSTTQVTNVVTGAGSGPVVVQSVKPPGQPVRWEIQTAKLPYNESVKIENALSRAFGVSNNQLSPQFVGPSWGGQISQKALEALIAFMDRGVRRAAARHRHHHRHLRADGSAGQPRVGHRPAHHPRLLLV
jgi:preprotein translocase subunit SecF